MNYKKIEKMERVFHKVRLGMVASLTDDYPFVAANLDIDTAVDWHTGNFLVKLRSYLLAEKHSQEAIDVYVEVPFSWFQHLKKALNLPYKKGHITKKIFLTQYWVYPEAPALDEHTGSRVMFVDQSLSEL